MTDPGTQLVVLVGIHARNARPNLLHPFQILSAQIVVHLLSRNWSDKPGSGLKQIRVGVLHAGLFLSGHGMTSEKTNTGVLTKDRLSAVHDLRLGATDVC